MTFTVDWISVAEDALTEIWLQAPDPNAVSAAQDQIDRLLARNPAGNGQHVHEGLYRIVVEPLTVFYSVDVARRRVEVSQVWYTP